MVHHHQRGDTMMAATIKRKKKEEEEFGHFTDKHLVLLYVHVECAISAIVGMYMPSFNPGVFTVQES